jgi:hypothetical protein
MPGLCSGGTLNPKPEEYWQVLDSSQAYALSVVAQVCTTCDVTGEGLCPLGDTGWHQGRLILLLRKHLLMLSPNYPFSLEIMEEFRRVWVECPHHPPTGSTGLFLLIHVRFLLYLYLRGGGTDCNLTSAHCVLGLGWSGGCFWPCTSPYTGAHTKKDFSICCVGPQATSSDFSLTG